MTLSPEIIVLCGGLSSEREVSLRSGQAVASVLPGSRLIALETDALPEWLDGAIAMRFGERAQTLRRESGKDTGTVRFEDDGVSVDADLPKRVDWDQSQLAALVERIRADGDDPSQYVDIAFKVPERKYSAWPNHIRTKFEPARTVKTGKPSITLSLTGDAR